MSKRLILTTLLVFALGLPVIARQTLTASITAAPATVTVVVASKTYDGNTSATVTSCTVSGTLAGDTVTCSATATFVSKQAGTARSWTAVVSKSGADAANYTVPTSANGTADITKKTVSLPSLVALDKVYDRTVAAAVNASGGLTGVIAPDACAFDPATVSATFADKNVGTNKPVTISGSAGLTGVDCINYTLTTGGGGGGPASDLPLLQPGDFTYVGYYDLSPQSLDSPFVQGLTIRRVNGDLRFLSLDNYGSAFEWSLAGIPLGGRQDAMTGHWPGLPPTGLRGVYNGIWWEEAAQRLWLTWAVDYTTEVIPSQIYSYTLNADGSFVTRGPFSLSGVPAKRAYGGVQPVPTWFRQQYGAGPYMTGFCGYTSLVAQGGGASMGLCGYAFPDISTYANGAAMPATTLADHAGAYGTDWYAAGAPNGFDRGVRLTQPINYFDGGDSRENPQTPPTGPPQASAQWLSPAPDGKGRFVWGDSYNNTGCWWNGPSKQGFVAIATLGAGKVYYQTSNLNYDSKAYELHIFDPADFGAVATGAKQPWQVQPTAMTVLTLPGMGIGGQGGGTPPAPNVIVAAACDPVGKRFYLLGTGGGGQFINRLYVLQVNG